MIASDIIITTKIKYIRCRELFGNIMAKYGQSRAASLATYTLVLCFLAQSEQSYIIREHELKKLVNEGEVKH